MKAEKPEEVQFWTNSNDILLPKGKEQILMETKLCDLEQDRNEELQLTLLNAVKSGDHGWKHFQNYLYMSK